MVRVPGKSLGSSWDTVIPRTERSSMTKLVALSLLLLGLPAPAAAIVLDSRGVAILADLFASGGYGRLPTERAAFLVLGEDGSLQCQAWPGSAQFQEASYHGTIPARAIAIAHTHPNHRPDPSAVDHALATRLGIPVLVVSRSGVVAARPGSRSPERIVSGRWSEVSTARGSCARESSHATGSSDTAR